MSLTMAALLQDLRYGLRMLAKNPGFTAVAVLSVAFGIGANTSVFSLIDAAMLRMLPVEDPEHLVVVNRYQKDWRWFFSRPDFEALREQQQVFSGMFASHHEDFDLTLGEGDTQDRIGKVEGILVSGDYFPALGVHAVLGRLLTAEDDRVPGSYPVAVISYRLWQRQFGHSASAIGKGVTLNGSRFTIVGVAAREFFGELVGREPDVWIPIMMQPQVMPGRDWLHTRTVGWLDVMGRLKPGVSLQQADAGLNVLYQHLIANYQPKDNLSKHRIELEPGGKGIANLRNRFSQPLQVLMALVGVLLLIACSNVATLLLARATSRKREISIRLALGCRRHRLIWQLLTESLLLATLGGLLGLLLAQYGGQIVLTLASAGRRAIHLDLHPDARVLLFTSCLCLMTGLLFGLAPALRASRLDLNSALKVSNPSRSGDSSKRDFSKVLVVAQVSLSLLLLVGAGLFVRTLRNLRSLDPGFRSDHVLLVRVDTIPTRYDDLRLGSLFEHLLERINAMPGIQAAGISIWAFGSGMSTTKTSIEGRIARPGDGEWTDEDHVSPRLFEAMGIPVLLGRTFTVRDNRTSARVAIINERLAHYYFPNSNPIGRQLCFGHKWNRENSYTIVGLVKDAKQNDLRQQMRAKVYVPFKQREGEHRGTRTLVVRGMLNQSSLASELQTLIHSAEPNLPVLDISSLSEELDRTLVDERLIAKLSSSFGLLALLLACVGLYGTMSYSLARRTNEIGIRMALGAQRGNIVGMVLRETLFLVLLGVAIGVPIALAATRLASSLISGLLFGLKATDPTTIALATLLMTAVAVFAGYLPARRASRVDPMVALRCE